MNEVQNVKNVLSAFTNKETTDRKKWLLYSSVVQLIRLFTSMVYRHHMTSTENGIHSHRAYQVTISRLIWFPRTSFLHALQDQGKNANLRSKIGSCYTYKLVKFNENRSRYKSYIILQFSWLDFHPKDFGVGGCAINCNYKLNYCFNNICYKSDVCRPRTYRNLKTEKNYRAKIGRSERDFNPCNRASRSDALPFGYRNSMVDTLDNSSTSPNHNRW